MANKPTKRERKDEAKRRRLEEMKRRRRRARRRKVVTAAVIGAIIAALGGAVLFQRAENASARNKAAELAASAGCEPPKMYPIEGQDHVSPPQRVSYKTDPPTSGGHYASAQPPAPTATGIHAQPIQDEVGVHNLEHGHIMIQYTPGSITPQQLTELEKVVFDNQQWSILAPRQNRGADVALTAWGIKQVCRDPNDNVDKVAAEFIKRFKNQGPESLAGQPVLQTQAPSPTATTSPRATASPSPSPTAQ